MNNTLKIKIIRDGEKVDDIETIEGKKARIIFKELGIKYS